MTGSVIVAGSIALITIVGVLLAWISDRLTGEA